jgi:hypothetical protein
MTEHTDRTRKEASEYLLARWRLSYAPNTLARMATTERGPPYHHRGRFAFYAEADLDAWAQTMITAPTRKLD